MSWKEFTHSLTKDDAEGDLIKTIFVSLITSFIVLALFYLFLSLAQFNVEDFFQKYGFSLFFVAASYALVLPSMRHVRAYREFPCMSGMMIGMTIGMIAGFLPGFFVASTNGMFWGSVFGMGVGIALGTWNGKCCGIMGFMEGIMAGFMGGLMGAMTAFMLLNDHLKASGIIVFCISTVIMIGLHFMIYKDTREMEKKFKEGEFLTIVLSSILTLVTALLIVFGPRSDLFR